MSDVELEKKIIEFKRFLVFILSQIGCFLWTSISLLVFLLVRIILKIRFLALNSCLPISSWIQSLPRKAIYWAEVLIRSMMSAEKFLTIFFSSRARVHIIFLFLLIFFFVIKSMIHKSVPAGEYEEFLKIKFALAMNGIQFFMPWQGNGGHFFGHPGLMNLLYFLWSKIFDHSLESLRIFCLTMSTIFLGTLYVFLRHHLSLEVSFFTVVSVLTIPIFQVESMLFLNELGSHAFSLASAIFYFRKNYLLFFIFSCAAFLYLEFSVAFNIAFIIYEIIFRRDHVKSELNKLVLLSAPLFFAASFFVVKNHFDPSGAHVTQDLVVRRLLNPLRVFYETNFSKLLMARWVTLKEALPQVFMGLWVLLAIKFSCEIKRNIKNPAIFIIFLSTVLQVGFTSFYSEKMGGRDFYLGFILVFILFFGAVRLFSGFRFISVMTLFLLSVNSVHTLTRNTYSWTGSTLKEYRRGEDIVRLRKKIEEIKGGPFKCYGSEFNFHLMFCTDFFGQKANNLISVDNFKESDVVILSPSLEKDKQQGWLSGLRWSKEIYLGKAHEHDYYLKFLKKLPAKEHLDE